LYVSRKIAEGHGGSIAVSKETAKQFDYETELVIVMGRSARNVSEADALAGLVIDRYGPVVVLQTVTLGMARRRAELATALQAIEHCAFRYLVKPVELGELKSIVRRAASVLSASRFSSADNLAYISSTTPAVRGSSYAASPRSAAPRTDGSATSFCNSGARSLAPPATSVAIASCRVSAPCFGSARPSRHLAKALASPWRWARRGRSSG